MTPAELKLIVDAWGGPDKFAAMLEVAPRTVYYWLSGKRAISQPVARLIRMLEPSKRDEPQNLWQAHSKKTLRELEALSADEVAALLKELERRVNRNRSYAVGTDVQVA